jgi:hypothetical protein
VQQSTAAAQLTQSAVQSFQTVQPFEPVHEYASFGATASSDYAYSGSSYDSLQPVPAASYTAPAHQHAAPAPTRAPRPLRTAELTVREEVGFDVAHNVHSAPQEPYLVPGVLPPSKRNRELTAASPSRPIAPERLYRPYLQSGGRHAIDLTMHDETAQLSKVSGYQAETG